MNIGEKIKNLRLSKLMTQKELAEKLNVTDKAVSKWETGDGMPDVQLLSPLANELGVTVDEILNGEEKQIEEIQLLIKSFNVLSSEQMNLKGGKIIVSYEVEPKKELKSEIDKKMIELYRKICDQNKGFSM